MSESSENPTASQEEVFTYLPKNPETRAKINEMFTQSGVAEKAVRSLMDPRPVNWKYPFEVDSCNFGVHKGLDWRGEKEQMSLVVEFPNPDPEQRVHMPRAEMYVGFDLNKPEYRFQEDKPAVLLDESQMQVVQDAVKLQEAEKTS